MNDRRYQGWDQPAEDPRPATPYGSTGGDHTHDRSATVIPIAAGAVSGFLTCLIIMTADVWAGWIG